MSEKISIFQNSVLGNESDGLLLTPPSVHDNYFLDGLRIMMKDGIQNKTILSGSPRVNGRSVSIEEWVTTMNSDSSNVTKVIKAQMYPGADFKSVGHFTLSKFDDKLGIYEERIYIYRYTQRNNGLGECALRLFVNEVKKIGIPQVVAFVQPTNPPSLAIHRAVFGEPKKGQFGKDYSVRTFSISM